MDEELKACEKLELSNVKAQRRNEELKVEVEEVVKKIEEIRRENQLLELEMESTVQETEAFLKQKEANDLCIELEDEAIAFAKGKLARLTVNNSKMSQENSKKALEWREHLDASEKMLSQIKGLYSSAPWIVEAHSAKNSIEVTKQETQKLWELIKASFESSGDDGVADEDAFIQQMTVIRRLTNKIGRNNREWTKAFPPKAKRSSAGTFLDADALLNDSLAVIDEDEMEPEIIETVPVPVTPKRQKPINEPPVSPECTDISVTPKKKQKLSDGPKKPENTEVPLPATVTVNTPKRQKPINEPPMSPDSSNVPVAPKKKQKLTDEPKKPENTEVPLPATVTVITPKRQKPINEPPMNPGSSNVPVAPKKKQKLTDEPKKPENTEVPLPATQSGNPAEHSSSSGEQVIFDCTTDDAGNEQQPLFAGLADQQTEETKEKDEPSFLAGLGGGSDANMSQNEFAFNFGSEGNETQEGNNGLFNMFDGAGDGGGADDGDNNGFQFNFGGDGENEESGANFNFNFN